MNKPAKHQAKTLSLVLGSGGARGLAHIGVIHELLDRGYQIRSICGSSIGALIGGVYAAGKLQEFESWVRAITPADMVSLMDLAWGRHGLVKGDKVISTLKTIVGERSIESLPIRFTAVATNISQGKEVWLNKGSLFDAIRASTSLPLFLTPVEQQGQYLIDGGVLNPVPIAPAFNDNTDLIVAVNLGGKDDPMIEQFMTQHQTSHSSQEPPSLFSTAVNRFITQMRSSEDTASDKKLGAYRIAEQAFDAMQSSIARQKLAAYPPDLIIEIPGNACATLDFDLAAPLIALGRQTAQQQLDNH